VKPKSVVANSTNKEKIISTKNAQNIPIQKREVKKY
jgi:hypothetical protein